MKLPIWILIFTLLLLSCSPIKPVEITSSPTNTTTATSRPLSTHTSRPTVTIKPSPTPSTETLPTQTATITVLPNPTPTISLTKEAQTPDLILQDTVTFSSNFLAESTGTLISFQHPRTWQTSYFSDSGVSGWLISDADPNEAFWSALSTGEESIFLIIPVYDLTYLRDLPAELTPTIIETETGTVRFILADGEINGNIIQDEMAFEFFGSNPLGKESEFQNVAETIFATFLWEDLGNTDLSDVWLLGTRNEGEIGIGNTVDGYVPMASISEWQLTGVKGQKFNLSIDTHDPAVMLILDVVDKDGISLLSNGAKDFTDSITMKNLTIPTDGIYYIQLTAPTGFGKLGPWNPPSENKIYGWYNLSLE